MRKIDFRDTIGWNGEPAECSLCDNGVGWQGVDTGDMLVCEECITKMLIEVTIGHVKEPEPSGTPICPSCHRGIHACKCGIKNWLETNGYKR